MSAVPVRAGVVGCPVSHSLSPVMMEAWLKDAGLDGTYERIAAAPDAFEATITGLRAKGYAGVNITLPHKEAALALADSASEAARAAGAANVLVFREDGVRADNTDITGVRAALEEGGWQREAGPAVLIGAGGAARAALHVLKAAGAPVRIVNRSPDRAEALAQSLACPAEIFAPDEAARAFASAALVINATSLGMKGQPAPDWPLTALPAGALVFDMVYVPLETPLLRAARALGLKTVDGLSMLIGQARPAFAGFFGEAPPSGTPVRALMEATLEAGQ